MCGTCESLKEPCSRGLRNPDGHVCPLWRDVPKTPEGAAAWRAASSEGVWIHAAVITAKGALVICKGMNFDAALSLADPCGELDGELLLECLRGIERGRLKGQADQAEAQSELDE